MSGKSASEMLEEFMADPAAAVAQRLVDLDLVPDQQDIRKELASIAEAVHHIRLVVDTLAERVFPTRFRLVTPPYGKDPDV